MKAAHREMYEHIDKIREKLKDDTKSPFENDRVGRLWKAVGAR